MVIRCVQSYLGREDVLTGPERDERNCVSSRRIDTEAEVAINRGGANCIIRLSAANHVKGFGRLSKMNTCDWSGDKNGQNILMTNVVSDVFF